MKRFIFDGIESWCPSLEKKKKYRTFKRLGRIFLVLLLVLGALIVFVRSPWGQDIIVTKAVDYVTGKTGTKVGIEKLFITFSGGIQLEGLFFEDMKGDTLVYSKSLEADVALSPLIFGNRFHLKELQWQGLVANITRNQNTEKFNFDFLLEALVPADTVMTVEETAPMQIDIGEIALSDFKLTYNDEYLGIITKLRLGEVYLDADEIDLETMRFGLDDLQLTNSEIWYAQSKPFAIEEDTTETQLPYLWVDDLEINNVAVAYRSVPDDIDTDMAIGNFQLELPKADLAKNEFDIENITLKDSRFSVRMNGPEAPKEDRASTADTSFEWPEFIVDVAKIDMQRNSIEYRYNQQIAKEGAFNPEAVYITDFTLSTQDTSYRPEQLNIQLNQFSFTEKSGLQLKKLAFDAKMNNTSAALSDVDLQINQSALSGGIKLQYPTASEFIASPERVQLYVDIADVYLAIQDALVFQPELANNDYVMKATQNPLTGSMRAKGTLAEIDISLLDIHWGEQTGLSTNGQLRNLMRTDSLAFHFPRIEAVSKRADILQFISEADLGISVPKEILFKGAAKGTVSEMDLDIGLLIPDGSAKLRGKYSNYEEIAFDGTLQVDTLRLDKLLENEQLGPVSFTLDAAGSGNDPNSLNASLKSNFTQLRLQDYDFSNLKLTGNIVNGVGAIDLDFKDNNLNLKARTKVELDSLESKIDFDFDLIGADLYALGVTKEEIKAGLQLKGNFIGNTDDFIIDAKFSDGIAVYDREQYRLGNIDLSTHIDTVTTNFSIKSNFLNGSLKSNSSPEKLNAALQRQFKGYFPNAERTEIPDDSVNLQLNMALTPVPILTEVFFRGVQRLDSINVQADFNAASKILNAKLYMPSAMYNGIGIDSLNMLVKGTATDLDFSVGLARIDADPIQIKRTSFKGNLQNSELVLDFSAYDDQEELVHIASEMTLAKDTVMLHISPSRLLFNKKQWAIPKDNRIVFSEKYLGLRNLTLSRNEQVLSLSNQISGINEEHFGVVFDNFKLQTFVSLLNPDEALTAGLVKGKFVIENPFAAAGLVADFKINDLKVMQNAIGNLSLDAVSKGGKRYDFNLALKDGGADLDLIGDYTAAETGAILNLDFNLNKLEMGLVQGLSDESLKNTAGYISGAIAVQGTTAEPKYKGELNFNQVKFNVSTLNSAFRINDESLKVDNSGLYLDNFQIGDANDNTFSLDGKITTDALTNPAFDLQLKAEQFQVLNSTAEDNELFYGLASFDADITVKGNLELPKVDGRLRVREITDITYIVPESELDVEERDGVVIFVNREDPDAILTRSDEEETPSLFRGMDVEAILEVADDAVFHIVIDEKTGDNLEISGDAALNLNIEPNGRINLSGRYELKSGHYETSLYNLVKRRFEIEPGGTITWQGDPTDAKLDVTAIYKVETSASPLMASVTSGEDASISDKYRQVLPFLVYLNVDGKLLEPKLSFALDMPEDEQGYLGGTVYGRVQQLNEQEADLNKQVFSLLALNRFFPTTGSDGSGGGTAALARDNVNKVLSGQLNAFSDKIFGKTGVELDFDLDSFTDYQGDTPQDRTQLNINAQKKLFNDRLIVTAGSAVDVEGSAQTDQAETPIIGNVSLEYLVSGNGRYRLKGYRKNEYTNVIDGQLIVTGVALIFQREFNKFSELFKPTEEAQSLQKKKNEDKRKADEQKNQD